MDEPTNDATYITHFAPHPEELSDETVKAVASTSTGIFGNFLNRIFKSSKDISIADNAIDTTAISISPSESCKNFDRPKHEEVGETPNTSTGKAFVLMHIYLYLNSFCLFYNYSS